MERMENCHYNIKGGLIIPILGETGISGRQSEILKIIRKEDAAEAGIAFYSRTNQKNGIITVGDQGELRFYDKNNIKHLINYT